MFCPTFSHKLSQTMCFQSSNQHDPTEKLFPIKLYLINCLFLQKNCKRIELKQKIYIKFLYFSCKSNKNLNKFKWKTHAKPKSFEGKLRGNKIKIAKPNRKKTFDNFKFPYDAFWCRETFFREKYIKLIENQYAENKKLSLWTSIWSWFSYFRHGFFSGREILFTFSVLKQSWILNSRGIGR